MTTYAGSIPPPRRPATGAAAWPAQRPWLAHAAVLFYVATQAAAMILGQEGIAGRFVPGAGGRVAAPPPAVSFVAQASGKVVEATNLYAVPAGGEVLGHLARDTALVIGGLVGVPAAIERRDVLWVQLHAGSDTPVYGFVPAGSILVDAGTPLRLDTAGLPRDALRSPLSAVQYAGGEGGAEAGAAGAVGADGAGVTTGAVRTDAAAGVPGEIDIPWLPATIAVWNDRLIAAGQAHGVDPALLAIVMLVESGGNPLARSGAGATGLMQVMPGTAADIARQRGLAGYTPDMLADPGTNIDFGAWYLSQQLKSFGSADDPDWQRSVEVAATAYNGGPGSAQRFLAGGGLPNETNRYLQWVGGMWRERRQAASPTFDAWMRAGGSALVQAAEQSRAAR